jgi:hypothetical protein
MGLNLIYNISNQVYVFILRENRVMETDWKVNGK